MIELTLSSGKKIKVISKEGNKEAAWSPSGENYRVTVKVGEKRLSFDFWDSIRNMEDGIPCDERGALACFASDAQSGENCNDVDEKMAAEFGYTKISEAVKAFKGLKRAQKQAKRIGLTWEDLSELSDY